MTATILSALAFTALCVSGTALSCVQNLPASAQTLGTVSAELVAPASYEEYLRLTAPADLASNENYMVIADGNSLYAYDRAGGIYREFVHTEPIEKVALDGEGNAYFLSALRLYKLSLQSLKSSIPQATETGIVCNGFSINDDVLCYYTNNRALIFYSLTNAEKLEEVTLDSALQDGSPLAFGKDSLYCVCENDANGYTVYAVNLETYGVKAITNFSEKLRSIAIASNLFCLSTQGGDFYSFNITELKAGKEAGETAYLTKDEGGYRALYAQDNAVYAVRNNTIRHYSAADALFTAYEIGASSPSANRLRDANEMLVEKNRLFIADNGNARISVYDTETETFEEALNVAMPASYLASYKNTLLIASENETAVYSLASRTYGEELIKIEDENIEGSIVGAASVYGRYYVLTEGNYCYTLSNESGEWTWEETRKNTQILRAMAFTADVYGGLYIAYDNDAVYRFTEKELTSATASGTKVLDGMQEASKIAVDYASNLYALSNGALTKYTQNDTGMYELNTEYTPSYGLVKDENPTMKSFAFGVDSAFTYLLYEGDYIVKTDEMQIPKVNPIPVGNAADLIFGDDTQNFTVVSVPLDSILIEFDVSLLQDANQFPYVAFERTQSVQTAMKIGEEGEYSILAIAKARTGKYKTCLVLTESCTSLAPAEYRTDYESPIVGHLTNDVSLYKFPYLNETLTVASLPRRAEIKLLGEIIQLDHAYYQISFTDENGNEKTGFVPKAYITLFDGSTPLPETVVAGAIQTDADAVWRCVYLILGFAAIAILVDFLILHKPKETE